MPGFMEPLGAPWAEQHHSPFPDENRERPQLQQKLPRLMGATFSEPARLCHASEPSRLPRCAAQGGPISPFTAWSSLPSTPPPNPLLHIPPQHLHISSPLAVSFSQALPGVPEPSRAQLQDEQLCLLAAESLLAAGSRCRLEEGQLGELGAHCLQRLLPLLASPSEDWGALVFASRWPRPQNQRPPPHTHEGKAADRSRWGESQRPQVDNSLSLLLVYSLDTPTAAGLLCADAVVLVRGGQSRINACLLGDGSSGAHCQAAGAKQAPSPLFQGLLCLVVQVVYWTKHLAQGQSWVKSSPALFAKRLCLLPGGSGTF